MDKLLLFNFALIAVIILGLWCTKKFLKSESSRNIVLAIAAICTILLHYSTLIGKLVSGKDAIGYLSTTPNLILPIYPCNVVMWSALIFAFLKNKDSKIGKFFVDYIFWFGILSTLVGMFANVDFIKNPTLADWENVKSITAHATLLFNVLLLPIFGYVKIDLKRNMTNIILSIVVMALIGNYCNLVFHVLVSKDAAYNVNSMFLIHSPFDGVDFLTYPLIALMAVPFYFIVFMVCDFCFHKPKERFYYKTKK